MKASKETVLIIPAYNEAGSVGNVIKQARHNFSYVVCVDDGSIDSTGEEVVEAGGMLVQHPINMGQGAAIQTGIEFARLIPNVKYFVTFDADGQHRIEDVELMLNEMATGKYDIVLGSRFLGKAVGMKFSKLLILKIAIKFSNFSSGLKLTDTHNGLRVFNKKVADEIQITMPNMAHASEILEIIAEKHYRYKEVPVIIEYTDYSRAKGQSIINAVNIGFDMLLRKMFK